MKTTISRTGNRYLTVGIKRSREENEISNFLGYKFRECGCKIMPVIIYATTTTCKGDIPERNSTDVLEEMSILGTSEVL
jgi:hypothetical protein